MCDWSSDVCSSDLDYCNRSHPVGVAVDCEGCARRNRKPPAQAGRECLANCTRTGVKEKIMTETIKLLRIYTDEAAYRSEEKTSELQSLMRITYAVFCLKKKNMISLNYKR